MPIIPFKSVSNTLGRNLLISLSLYCLSFGACTQSETVNGSDEPILDLGLAEMSTANDQGGEELTSLDQSIADSEDIELTTY